MESCLRILKKSGDFFFRKSNVVGVGVGMKKVGQERTKQPSIIVFVEKKVHRDNLSRGAVIPEQLDGVQTDVIEIGRVRLLDVRTGMERPARPGMSIGHYKITAGTFGAVVKDRNTRDSLILSNNHILANATDGSDGRSSPGDPILQPGAYDGGTDRDKIAELVRFIPLMRSAKEADCPVATGAARIGSMLVHAVRPNYDMRLFKRYGGSNIVDAAVARPVSADLISDDILEIGAPRGTATAGVGQTVIKSGRSSGVTSGEVTATQVSLQVDLSDNEVGMFSDQVVTEMVSKGGDSGSLVLDDSRKAVGLLFAGSDTHTIFNHLSNVFSKLGVYI